MQEGLSYHIFRGKNWKENQEIQQVLLKKKPIIFHTERDIKENKQVDVLYIEGETNFLK